MSPGVYLMRDKSGQVIYVGKAKVLKNRVSSYFHGLERHQIKTYKLVDHIYDFDFIVTNSELDALILESGQIKLRNPKYNILLKDAKGANYIKVSGGDYPRLSYALQTSDKSATYLGPYAETYTIREAVGDVNHIFRLPDCTRKFPEDFGKQRPCLNFHINRCMGVCRGNIPADEYKAVVHSALEYIRKGSKDSIARLTAEMEHAAENLEFERAGRLRDQIQAIERTENAQQIVSGKSDDFDCLAMAQNLDLISVAVIKYRNGRLIDKENFFLGEEYNHDDMQTDFITQYYQKKDEIPKYIYLETESADDVELLTQFLCEKAGRKVRVQVPKRGEALTLLTLAKSNAAEYLALKVGRTAKEIAALETLAKLLSLPKTPLYIESYDISNLGEQTKVAGMVVYRNGRPFKAGYRKFTVKTVAGVDDYASMQEVLRRRFTRYLEGDEGFSIKPDLILLDGGQGHVSAVGTVLSELGLQDIPLFGLVKDDRHRTRAIARQGGEIAVNAHRQAFTLINNIQDEVHRFSITFQRAQHKKQNLQMILTEAPGIGEKKAVAIFAAFKTKEALLAASPEELRTAAKVSPEKAQVLHDFIHEKFD